jgi:hypothetical protein
LHQTLEFIGVAVGIFGQDHSWDFNDQTTFSGMPADVKQENILEKKKEQLVESHREHLKKAVINLWKSLCLIRSSWDIYRVTNRLVITGSVQQCGP